MLDIYISQKSANIFMAVTKWRNEGKLLHIYK